MIAKDRALEALRANPRKSNRAIADEIGVSKDTVRRAREATRDQSLIDKSRVGLDGKIYPARILRNKRPESLRGVFAELSGLSAQKVADEFNIRNLLTPSGRKWHATQVIRIRKRFGIRD